MSEDPKRWSQPFAALLGAYNAQIGFGLPSIGGKDSMSGTFNDIDVPPTLVSFAITASDVHDVMTPEAKEAGHILAEVQIKKDQFRVFDFDHLLSGTVFCWQGSGRVYYDTDRAAVDRKCHYAQSWHYWLLYRQNIRRSKKTSTLYHFQYCPWKRRCLSGGKA